MELSDAPASALAQTLRRRAQAVARNVLNEGLGGDKALSPEQLEQTLYELRVHQIELEMQNEELRLAQDALHTERERYFDLYDLAPVGYCTVSDKGLVLQANLMAASMLGISRSALLQKAFIYFVDRQDRGNFQGCLKRLEASAEVQACELRLRSAAGLRLWVHLTASTAPDDFGTAALRVVLTDISQQKDAEQMKQKLAENKLLSHDALEHSQELMVTALTRLSHYRDNETGQHITRTQRYVGALAQALVKAGRHTDQLNQHGIDLIVKATPMHDLGKVGVPDQILMKPGPLTSDEVRVMQTHAAIGEAILLVAADGALQHDSLLTVASRMAGGHHENWDGSGYPHGQKGEAIAIEARMMALADVYDALTSPRIYKQAWSHAAASAEIMRLSGTKFDPAVAAAFQQVEQSFCNIAEQLGGT